MNNSFDMQTLSSRGKTAWLHQQSAAVRVCLLLYVFNGNMMVTADTARRDQIVKKVAAYTADKLITDPLQGVEDQVPNKENHNSSEAGEEDVEDATPDKENHSSGEAGEDCVEDEVPNKENHSSSEAGEGGVPEQELPSLSDAAQSGMYSHPL